MSAAAAELMPRPSLRDAYVRRRAAEIIFPQILGWALSHGGPLSEKEQSEWMEDLGKVAREAADGYEMAKDLERHHGWTADSMLVEILDSGWVDDAIRELTEKWVRCLDVKPQFKIGDAVRCNVRPSEDGVIVKIDEKLAKYGVHYPDMKEKSYYVVNYENCSAVIAEVENGTL